MLDDLKAALSTPCERSGPFERSGLCVLSRYQPVTYALPCYSSLLLSFLLPLSFNFAICAFQRAPGLKLVVESLLRSVPDVLNVFAVGPTEVTHIFI